MEQANGTTLVLYPESKDQKPAEKQFFDFQLLNKESRVPDQFIWPAEELIKSSEEELQTPIIDLMAIKNDEAAMANAAKLVNEACKKHGFFAVINHGVDPNLISDAYEVFDSIFKLPLDKKLSAKKKPWGYSGAHAERFNTTLPWKETFTFQYKYVGQSELDTVDIFNSLFGEGFQHTGMVYHKYCEAMKEVSMIILELLAISLGAESSHFQKFYEDTEGMMRINSYPPCSGYGLTMGTGPHCDPTSITILHQDQIGGLEAFVDDKWFSIRPRPDAFVINIGDTFSALSNGKYKSCLHRVLASRESERKSMSFFLNPKEDKIVIPPQNLFGEDEPRKYPNFTWADLFQFTQKYHRADSETLPKFASWIRASKPSNF